MARRLVQSFVIAFLAAVSASAPAVQAAQAAEITVGGRATDVLARPLAEADVIFIPSLDLLQQPRLAARVSIPSCGDRRLKQLSRTRTASSAFFEGRRTCRL